MVSVVLQLANVMNGHVPNIFANQKSSKHDNLSRSGWYIYTEYIVNFTVSTRIQTGEQQQISKMRKSVAHKRASTSQRNIHTHTHRNIQIK